MSIGAELDSVLWIGIGLLGLGRALRGGRRARRSPARYAAAAEYRAPGRTSAWRSASSRSRTRARARSARSSACASSSRRSSSPTRSGSTSSASASTTGPTSPSRRRRSCSRRPRRGRSGSGSRAPSPSSARTTRSASSRSSRRSTCSRAAARRSWSAAGRSSSRSRSSATTSATTTALFAEKLERAARTSARRGRVAGGSRRVPAAGAGSASGLGRRRRDARVGRARRDARPADGARDHRRAAGAVRAVRGAPSRAAAAEAGREPPRLSINSHGYIAETREQALDESFPYVSAAMNRIGQERGWPPMPRADYDAAASRSAARTSSGRRRRSSRRSSSSTRSSGTTASCSSSRSAGSRTRGSSARSSSSAARSLRPCASGCPRSTDSRIAAARARTRQWGAMSQVVDALDDARAAAARQAWRAAYGAYVGVGDERPDRRRPRELRRGGVVEREARRGDRASRARVRRLHGRRRPARRRADGAHARAGTTRVAARSPSRTAGWRTPSDCSRISRKLPEHGASCSSTRWPRCSPRATSSARSTLFDEAYELAAAGRRPRRARCSRSPGRDARSSRSGEIDKGLALLDEATASAMCGDLRAHSAGPRLLHHDQLVPGPRRLPARGRVDGGGEPLVRQARRHGLPGRVPHPPRRGAPASRRLVGRRGAGRRGVRGAPRLRPHRSPQRALRDRRDPASPRRLRGSRGGVPHLERDGPRAAAGALAPPARRGQGRRRRRGDHADARRTPHEPLFRFRRLPAQVEIAIAAGDLKTARAAADESEQIVDSYKIGDRRAAAFDATVHFARGQIQLAEKDWDGAIASLQRARDEWQGVGAPYETARARMLLGTAYTRSGRRARRRTASSRARSRRSSGSARASRRRASRSSSAGSRRGARSSSPTSSTRRSCSRRSATTSGSGCSRATTSSCASAIAEAGGEVVKQTGDGFFASFENPKAAIDAAIAIQRALADGDRRAGRADRRALGRGVPHRRRVDRLRRPGRARRVAHRRRSRGGRDPRQRRDARRHRHVVPALASRARETLKGVEQPVEVVSVDWR